MSDNFEFAPEVEADISEAYEWYEDRRVGLGEDFLSSLDACLQRVRRLPESYAVVYDGFRRALIRRFPYAIFYRVLDGKVTVYAVFHNAREPGKWRDRAR